MDAKKYEEYLQNNNHTEKSIKSRISRLRQLENMLNFNIDDIIKDRYKVLKLLKKLKAENLDTYNQNYSNTIRKYYKCITNDEIKKGEVNA